MQDIRGTRHTTGATVPSGFNEIQIHTEAAYTGNIANMAFTGATTVAPIVFKAVPGEKLGALTFTVSAGALRIFTL